ncbi:MAG: rhodanese-like domain-containing protein [Alphaproteobacteria bacterium]|nr:rhodanese-like domain-containing protein [Alphaproteobacteria bacterium]
MTKKLNKSAADLVAAARDRIEEISSTDAIAMADDENVLIVDLRDIRERQRMGYIPGSFHCPRGMAEFWVDPESPYFKPEFGQDKLFLFHCASGWRSALTVATLQDMGMERVAHIRDGFKGWSEAGGPIVAPESD